MIFAYVRVSSKDQNIERQLQAVREYQGGISDECIYIDKESGKDFNREQYQELKKILRKGDTLIIKELDRLGRNMEAMKEEWNELLRRGVNIIVLDTPILNTINKSDLEKNLISNIVFELLSYMAEKERLKNKQRQAEGIAIAKEQGKYTGREKGTTRVSPKDFEKVYRQWKEDKITVVQAVKLLDYKSRTSFYNMVKVFEESK